MVVANRKLPIVSIGLEINLVLMPLNHIHRCLYNTFSLPLDGYTVFANKYNVAGATTETSKYPLIIDEFSETAKL
jgi:hypothetical protein